MKTVTAFVALLYVVRVAQTAPSSEETCESRAGDTAGLPHPLPQSMCLLVPHTGLLMPLVTLRLPKIGGGSLTPHSCKLITMGMQIKATHLCKLTQYTEYKSRCIEIELQYQFQAGSTGA